MRVSSFTATLALLVSMGCGDATGPEYGSAVEIRLEGVVTQAGRPLSGAIVRAAGPGPCGTSGCATLEAVTDLTGRYVLEGSLPAETCGEVTVTAEKSGRGLVSDPWPLSGCGPQGLDFDFPESELLGVIEWPFRQLAAEVLPDLFEIDLYYNGFYNPAPCDNAHTTIPRVAIPWGGTITREWDLDVVGFAGFAACLTDGRDQTLSMGVEGVSGWAAEESMALDRGVPDLQGTSPAYVRLVVDQSSVSGAPGAYTVTVVMRWLFFGTGSG